jgi:hypothetical protein
MRLKDKIAIVAGRSAAKRGLRQRPRHGFAFRSGRREGAVVDNNFSSAEVAIAMARQVGGECVADRLNGSAKDRLFEEQTVVGPAIIKVRLPYIP